MRKKSLRHFYLGWFILLGMLFHVLISHQSGLAELIVNQEHDKHQSVAGHVLHIHTQPNEQAEHSEEPLSHKHVELDHPSAYTCPSISEVQDQLSLRLASLLASLPLHIEIPQPPFKLAETWASSEPQPPPEQLRRVLTTTILLI